MMPKMWETETRERPLNIGPGTGASHRDTCSPSFDEHTDSPYTYIYHIETRGAVSAEKCAFEALLLAV